MRIFRYEWAAADPYPEPIAHRTMADLRIVVGDCVATDLYDECLNQPGDSIRVPMSRIAEWLVLNWWYLWFEADSVAYADRHGFAARHNLAYAGHGFVLPQLSLQPFGDQMRIRVQPWNPRDAPLRFRGACDVLLPRVKVERELEALVEDVFHQLRGADTPFDDLQADWQAIRSVGPDEREFCQAAALAGLDPFDLPDSVASAVERFWNDTAPSLREDALHGVETASVVAVTQWLPRQLAAVEEIESGDEWSGVQRVARASLTAGDMPWQRGYAAARAVRRELDVPWGSFALNREGPLRVGNRTVTSPSAQIEGCVAADSPSCVVIKKHAAGKRFLLARALGEYMTRTEAAPALLGTRDTPRQAESRAFAAEFLAPSKWLRSSVGTARTVDPEAVDELAQEAGVSSWVIRHQLANHGITEVADARWPASA